ncbi:MAG: RNA methyltransferase [Proteobacteria bacterium]|nr:RNA methyltransferase [Pseudomonadota bacterium]
MHPPVIILVRPQMGENIGAVARIMANFGLAEMRIVAPRDGWPNPQAIAMASGATHIIDDAKIFNTTAEAVADLQYISATTGRPRDMVKPCYDAVEGVIKCVTAYQSRMRVGLLFGPERTGLENEDLVLTDAIVTIPTSPEFPSLNLAQSVAVMLYQWVVSARTQTFKPPEAASPRASKEEVWNFLNHLEQALDKAGHFKSPDMKPKMLQNLQSPFLRANLTEQEVRTLFGVMASLTQAQKK